MPYIYAMSDIHGELGVLQGALSLIDMKEDDKLILLGDYIRRGKSDYSELYFIKKLWQERQGQVIVLMGNHELMFLEDIENGAIAFADADIIDWVKSLPFWHETDTQIFVHAGIDEDEGEFWSYAVDNYYLCNKRPYTIGHFYKDIIAGHTGTRTMTRDRSYHKVFWDGESHFYIDGTTQATKFLPILKYNTATGTYSTFDKTTDENGEIHWFEELVKLGASKTERRD